MARQDRERIVFEGFSFLGILSEKARECIVRLLNIIEDLTAALWSAQAEIQRLRDENNRLKGEQGKPNIKANAPKSPLPLNYSSEQERHVPKPWSKDTKKDKIHIDREETLRVDPAILPPDAEFKGYEEVVVQDVILRTDNICFRKEKYYSPSQGKTYLAPLPAGYSGQFGPGIKSLAIVLYFGSQVSEPKILELFRNLGVLISDGELSNLLIKRQDSFHGERDAVYEAGLRSSPWQHLDETSTRVNGQNQHCQIVCNPLYTAYFTTESKDRQSVLEVLRHGQPATFVLNCEADRILEVLGVSKVVRQQLTRLPRGEVLDEETMLRLLEEHLPKLGPRQRRCILDASGVAAYHAQVEFPVVKLLVCDDAPQFALVTEELALCWVHEGRHYKKMMAYVEYHRQLLEAFRGQFWEYYSELLAYRQSPSGEERERLAVKFDQLFSTKTGFEALDDRIAKSKAKKVCLLMVLEHPEISLHNNPAELGVRTRVRKQDVSFGPRTADGARAWDTFMTLEATARKLDVSFYAYIHDRISETRQMPGLDSVIERKATELNLGASWKSTV